MPFTFAHPAVVFPLIKKLPKYFSATGLIAGSIIPDFEYFVRLYSLSIITHTKRGLLLVDVPAALALCIAFHWFIKQALIPNLPSSVRKYFLNLLALDWMKYFKSNFPAVIVSCLIGAATHIAWDSISHTTGQMVQHFDFLSTKIIFEGAYMYRVIWWLSSLLGSWYVINQIKKNKSSGIKVRWKQHHHYWAIVFLLVVIILLIDIKVFIHPHLYRDFFTAALGSLLFSIIFTSALFCLFKKQI